MKKYLFIVLSLVALNVALFATAQYGGASDSQKEFNTVLPMGIGDPIDDGSDPECYSGGVGSTDCMIEAGVTLDLGVSGSCSVSCGRGYYTCCGLRCKCKRIEFVYGR